MAGEDGWASHGNAGDVHSGSGATDVFVQIVEFPSSEEAMLNSELPETAALAERLARLCHATMPFRNLDVRSVEER